MPSFLFLMLHFCCTVWLLLIMTEVHFSAQKCNFHLLFNICKRCDKNVKQHPSSLFVSLFLMYTAELSGVLRWSLNHCCCVSQTLSVNQEASDSETYWRWNDHGQYVNLMVSNSFIVLIVCVITYSSWVDRRKITLTLLIMLHQLQY